MNKNYVMAIVLSMVVLIGFMFVQTKFFPPAPVEQPVENSSGAAAGSAEQTESAAAATSTVPVNLGGYKIEEADDAASVAEQTYTISTKKVKVTFTNRGGDIISYELLDHPDIDTGKGVELADNISAVNRSCALSFGMAENAIIDDVFSVKQLGDLSIGFFKTYHLKNTDGSDNSFTLIKQYTFDPGEYMFKLDVIIDGITAGSLNFNGASYTLRTSPQIGPHFDRKVDRYESRSFITWDGEKSKKIVMGDKTYKSWDKQISWAGIAGKYFMSVAVPEHAGNIGKVWYSTNIEKGNYANAQALLVRNPISGQSVQDTYYMYFGPRSEKEVTGYNTVDGNAWKLSGVKLTEGLQTSGFLSWLEAILKWMMEMIYKVIPNWGVSIIIMTIILKMLMFPLTKKSAMGTLKMQELQPKMSAIQEKYKNQPQVLQQETAKLYKEAGYNPVSGCLPMLFTFVVLFAMYNLFNNYFEFRGASFIKGWIPDLSRGDSIYRLGTTLPFIGSDIRILPIIYLISQLLFGKITGNGGTATGSNANQMKLMMYGMPIFFFFIFYNAPAGLLLFWTVSNIVQMLQQLAVNKMMAGKKAEAAPAKTKKGSEIIKKFPSGKGKK